MTIITFDLEYCKTRTSTDLLGQEYPVAQSKEILRWRVSNSEDTIALHFRTFLICCDLHAAPEDFDGIELILI